MAPLMPRSYDQASIHVMLERDVLRGACFVCETNRGSALRTRADRNRDKFRIHPRESRERRNPCRCRSGVVAIESEVCACQFGGAWFRAGGAGQDELLRLESQAERGFADTEFGALAEHGGADALFFEECAVGGIEVAEIGVVIADFDDAMVAGDFGIFKGDVGAVAADYDARFFECVSGACAGARR